MQTDCNGLVRSTSYALIIGRLGKPQILNHFDDSEMAEGSIELSEDMPHYQ